MEKHPHYEKIEKAIRYICENYQEQPSLSFLAHLVDMTPHHFQKTFSMWSGVSPKKFCQYITLNQAKEKLESGRKSLLQTTYDIGLSSPSRLHDLFLSAEGMTPGQFKDKGEGLLINYSLQESPFGKIVVASTNIGICSLFFASESEALPYLRKQFPKALLKKREVDLHGEAVQIFDKDWIKEEKLKLHLQGTPFQLKVWECLLKIPMGAFVSYGDIAEKLGDKNASRAVGSAVGKNPIGYLIPCHRVIQKNGNIGGFLWGVEKKREILAWEFSKLDEEQ